MRDPLDRLWRDFCNLYGLAWGLRVAERFNASAAANRWPVTLTWRGFRSPSGDGSPGLSAAEREAVAENLASWLRRFVEPTWIAERVGTGAVGAEPDTAEPLNGRIFERQGRRDR